MKPELLSEAALEQAPQAIRLPASASMGMVFAMRGSTPAGSFFSRFARRLSRAMGEPLAFAAALLIVIVWAIMGPIFHFSDTWQLVINTGTTVVTFLMVFLIQNTQNRDGDAIQVKLDELIRTSKAHNALLDLEELDQKDLDHIKRRYEELAGKARKELKSGRKDTNSPLVKSG